MHDPRESSAYSKLYTVDYLNNVVGGGKVLYVNQPIDVLKKLAAESIKKNQVQTGFYDICADTVIPPLNSYHFQKVNEP